MKKFILTTLALIVYIALVEFMLTKLNFKKTKNDFEYYISQSFTEEEWAVAKEFVKEIDDVGQRAFHRKGTLNYFLKPYKGKYYNVNSLGFRGEEVKPKADDEIRIMVMGASVIWGMYVPDNQTIPALLEKKLREKYRKNITVYNLGIEGYNFQRSFSLAKILGGIIKPDIIIFYTGISDIWYSYGPGYIKLEPFQDNNPHINPFFEREKTYDREIDKVIRETRIGNIFYKELETAKIFGAKNNSNHKINLTKEQKSKLLFNAESFADGLLEDILAAEKHYKERGIKTVFFFDNMLSTKKNKTELEKMFMNQFEMILPNFEYYTNLCLNRLFSQPQSKIIHQTYSVFDNVEGEIFWDALHINPRGHRIIADKMFEIIVENNYIEDIIQSRGIN